MNKNCQGCAKIFSFDESINPDRKFCNKDCYLSHVRKKPEVPKTNREDLSRVETVRTKMSRTQKVLKFVKRIFKKG